MRSCLQIWRNSFDNGKKIKEVSEIKTAQDLRKETTKYLNRSTSSLGVQSPILSTRDWLCEFYLSMHQHFRPCFLLLHNKTCFLLYFIQVFNGLPLPNRMSFQVNYSFLLLGLFPIFWASLMGSLGFSLVKHRIPLKYRFLILSSSCHFRHPT